jgi:uncharacterized protein YkwD
VPVFEEENTPEDIELGATLDAAHGTVDVILEDVPEGTSVWLLYGNDFSDTFCSDLFDGLCLDIDAPRVSAERIAETAGTLEMSVETDRFASAHLVQAVYTDADGDFVALPPVEAAPPEIPDKPCRPNYAQTDAEIMECHVLDLVNEARTKGVDCGEEGVYPPAQTLSMHPQLMDAARVHSMWMAETGTFSHGSPGGPYGDNMVQRVEASGYTNWRRIAENIAFGQPDAEVVVQAWLNSDGHCANLMNPHLEHIGVGLMYNRNGRPYWTQDFGSEF